MREVRGRVFLDGRVLTLDAAGTRAQAIATRGGRIVAIGRNAQIRELAGLHTDVVDLRGRVVVPGFIETHAHVYWYGMTLGQVDLQPWVTPSIEDAKRALRAAADATPAGEWVQGYGFDPNLVGEHRNLTRRDLDEAVPDHPVFITVGHTAWANSRALERSGISADTPDPPGGHFERDESGEPNGVLVELSALLQVARHIPPLERTASVAALRAGADEFARNGVTTVHDPFVPAFPNHFEALQAVSRDPRFPLRVVAFPASHLRDRLPLTTGFGDDRLRLGPLKLFADGSIQYYTGALKEPYHSPPESRPFRCCGFRTIEPKDLAAQALEAHRNGFQVAIHANGDDGIEAAIDALAGALEAEPRDDHRHRIEHCQTASEDQLARMAALGIHVSFFVNHVYWYGDLHREETLGPERAARISPLASALRHRVRFALHSDSPVTPVSPLASMWTAVERRTRSGRVLGEKQRISAEAALRAYTSEAARLCHEERDKGTLEVGKLADFALLSDDPLSVPPGRLREIRVEGTVLGGKPLWRRGA